jgi:hypothetical protein
MRSRLLYTVLLGACLALAAQAAQDATQPDALTPEAAGVKKLLESRFPGATVGVVKSPYFDLYEAQFDDALYTDAKVTYVMVGSV